MDDPEWLMSSSCHRQQTLRCFEVLVCPIFHLLYSRNATLTYCFAPLTGVEMLDQRILRRTD